MTARLLKLLAITFVTPAANAGTILDACDTRPDFYYDALKSLLDKDQVGAVVASVNVVTYRSPEFGIRIIERDASYVVRVALLARSLYDASFGAKQNGDVQFDAHGKLIPVRTVEFEISAETARRIGSAVANEISKAGDSHSIAIPDNSSFYFSAGNTSCGIASAQDAGSPPDLLSNIFLELERAAFVTPQERAAPFATVNRLLKKLEAS